MKIPNNIKTLTKLSEWVTKENPKTIEISKESKIKEIREFNKGKQFTWNYFRGLPIKYR